MERRTTEDKWIFWGGVLITSIIVFIVLYYVVFWSIYTCLHKCICGKIRFPHFPICGLLTLPGNALTVVQPPLITVCVAQHHQLRRWRNFRIPAIYLLYHLNTRIHKQYPFIISYTSQSDYFYCYRILSAMESTLKTAPNKRVKFLKDYINLPTSAYAASKLPLRATLSSTS